MFRTVVEDFFVAAEASEEPAPPGRVTTREECLEQILSAYCDIADLDDIHQAAQRLASVAEWICGEARRAAADPIFDA